MDSSFYFTYILVPILLSILYCYAKKNDKHRTIGQYNFLKGLFYFYLVISIILNYNTERYVTGLTICIAILEGTTGIITGIESMKLRKK